MRGLKTLHSPIKLPCAWDFEITNLMLKFSSGAMSQQVNSAELCCLSSDAKLEFKKN
jgi:hypothetical protein